MSAQSLSPREELQRGPTPGVSKLLPYSILYAGLMGVHFIDFYDMHTLPILFADINPFIIKNNDPSVTLLFPG